MSDPQRPRALQSQRATDLNFTERVPDGDSRERLICDTCGYVHYVNPVVVVGVVCTYDDRYVLCRRAIEPRRGYWTMPAGFLEEGESTESGARREAREEAGIDVEIDALLGVYDIPIISQIQLIYRGSLRSPDLAPGEESLEARLFRHDEIPWDEIAFPSVHWALGHHREARGATSFPPFRAPVEIREPGDGAP